MNETLIAIIALAIAAGQTPAEQTRQLQRDTLRRAALAEPVKLIGKPLTPLHPVPIVQPPLKEIENR